MSEGMIWISETGAVSESAINRVSFLSGRSFPQSWVWPNKQTKKKGIHMHILSLAIIYGSQ